MNCKYNRAKQLTTFWTLAWSTCMRKVLRSKDVYPFFDSTRTKTVCKYPTKLWCFTQKSFRATQPACSDTFAILWALASTRPFATVFLFWISSHAWVEVVAKTLLLFSWRVVASLFLVLDEAYWHLSLCWQRMDVKSLWHYQSLRVQQYMENGCTLI